MSTEYSTLINFANISFPDLFLLREKLSEAKNFKSLNIRNKLALKFVENILTDKKTLPFYEEYSKEELQTFKDVLKWILNTGITIDGIDDSYDDVIDKTAILLSKEFKDDTVLPIIADKIFDRHSKGLFIHDLVWGFFESHNFETLKLVAKRLRSNNKVELELACKLLNIKLPSDYLSNPDFHKTCTHFPKWLDTNKNFLYFTGENFQQRSNPNIFAINHTARYICMKVCINNGNFLNDLYPDQKYLISKFNLMDDHSRLLLENYSVDLYNRNYYFWKDWISCPVTLQLQIALGGSRHDQYIR